MINNFAAAPVVPVIVINDVKQAIPMAEALLEGGLHTLEVTLRTPQALDAIQAISDALPEAYVGVGTAINAQQLRDAQSAGAHFAVSPGFTEELDRAAKELDIPLLPGVGNASDILRALAAGYEFVKFFPAEAMGGVAALKALGGPFSQLRFCPTGGIGMHNVEDYLALPQVACVGGSWVLPSDALSANDWSRIKQLASQASQLLR